MENPFFYGNPVPPERFYNRRQEVRRLVGRILNYGQSVAVVGEPHIGKTSLLHYIWAPENRDALYGEGGARLVFSFLDAQALGGQFTQAEFWERALAPLVEQVIERQAGTPLAAQYMVCVQNHFGTFNLMRLFEVLRQAGWRLVLLVDEFDALLYHPVLNNAEFYGGLRYLASNNGGALALVLTSRQPLSQLNAETQQFNPSGSPYFNIFKEIQLKKLPDKDIAEMIQLAGEVFSAADRRYIHAVAGGHPYLLQLTAAAMWEALQDGEKVVEHRHRTVGQQVYQETKLHFADTWRLWTTATRKAVATIALAQIPTLLGNHDFSKQKFLKALPDFTPEIHALENVGLVERNAHISGGYRLTQGALLWWLADELLRVVRQDVPFDEWLRGQHLRGPVTENELNYLKQAGQFARDLLQQGAATLIEAFAKGVAGES